MNRKKEGNELTKKKSYFTSNEDKDFYLYEVIILDRLDDPLLYTGRY